MRISDRSSDVCSSDLPAARAIALITDSNPRRRLALLAARFHGRQPETVAVVTGTNGKTSVASFTRPLWQTLAHESASLGTLGLPPPRPDASPSLTPPAPRELHRCIPSLPRASVNDVLLDAPTHCSPQY